MLLQKRKGGNIDILAIFENINHTSYHGSHSQAKATGTIRNDPPPSQRFATIVHEHHRNDSPRRSPSILTSKMKQQLQRAKQSTINYNQFKTVPKC